MEDREDLREKGLETEKVFLEVVKTLNEEPVLDRDAQERVLRKISQMLKDFAPPSDREERLYNLCRNLSLQLGKAIKYNELLIDTLNQLLNLLEILLREDVGIKNAGEG